VIRGSVQFYRDLMKRDCPQTCKEYKEGQDYDSEDDYDDDDDDYEDSEDYDDK